MIIFHGPYSSNRLSKWQTSSGAASGFDVFAFVNKALDLREIASGIYINCKATIWIGVWAGPGILIAVGATELDQIAGERLAKVEEFQRKHRTGFLTLLLSDIVGSMQLKQTLGDEGAVPIILRHHATIREILNRFNEAQEIETAGDSFLLVFGKPSDAVKFFNLLR